VIEVLALDCLPTNEADRPPAIARFFTDAAEHLRYHGSPQDPAGLCGVIQRDLEVERLIDALEEAAQAAALAVSAAARTDYDKAIAHWHNVFGSDFPKGGGASGVPVVVPPRPVKDSPQG
jgi:hypothetical protein